MENVFALTPAANGYAITPGDDALPNPTRGIMVGSNGNVSVRFIGGDEVVLLRNLTAGVVYPLQLSHVFASHTTATNIVGLY